MNESLSPAAEARARLHGERLLENSQLRDGLTDEQAGQIDEWALEQLRRSAAEAEDRPVPDAYMEEQAQAVSRILRQVNGLTPTFIYLVEDELAEELVESFMSSVTELTGHELGDAWFDDAMERRPWLDEASTFQLFMDALRTAAHHE